MSLAITDSSMWVLTGPSDPIPKAPGDNFSLRIAFWHKGKPEDVIVGVGLAYLKEILIFPWLGHNTPFVWAMTPITVEEDGDWEYYSALVGGKIPEDAGSSPGLIESIINLFLGGGVKLDAYCYVAKATSPEEAESEDWDDDVYIIAPSGGVFGGIVDILPLMMMIMMMSMIMPMMQTSK